MKKYKIGENQTSISRFENDSKRKLRAFNDLYNFVILYIDEPDKKKLSVDPIAYFTEEYYKQVGKPAFLSAVNTLKHSDIDLDKLERLSTTYLRINIDFDGVNFKQNDFGIYATNEAQVNLFEDLKQVCDKINHLYKYGFTIPVGSLSSSLNGMIIIDYSNYPLMIPNSSFVKQFGIKY
jgi:hypothetical protein